MKKRFIRIISLTLVFSIVLSIFAIQTVSAEESKVSSVSGVEEAIDILLQNDNDVHLGNCNGNCDHSPVIIVPGIMQSQVYVQDENGNDLLTSDGFPIVEGMDLAFMIDMKKIEAEIPMLILSLIKALFMADRDVFLDDVVEIFRSSFESHYFNPDSTRVNNVHVDEYWYSYAESMKKPDKSYGYAQGYGKDEDGNTLPSYRYKTEYDFIASQVDITEFCETAGYDHAYYFAYSSFGDTLETAEKLDRYIQMVKEQTGHDKVNIVFISLGGTIGNAYLAKHCNPDDIDRIIFAAAAADGSLLLSDLMEGAFALDDKELLYNEFIPELLKIARSEDLLWIGYLANIVLRILPNSIFSDLAQYALERLSNEVLSGILRNCPSMWALVPSSEYERLAEKYISDEAHKALKEKTDEYYNIQLNAGKTLQKLTEEGMDIFVVCGYNLALPTVIDSWNISSDNIINASSTSFGATFSAFGEKLPDDYVPAIDESYISPDREVDAGTCALPDRTWFVRNQSHLRLQSSVNDIITMCMQIVSNDEITDARVNNGGYKQFNNYRALGETESLFREYNNALNDGRIDSLSDEDKAKLNSSYTALKEIYDSKDWNVEETLRLEKQFYTDMYEMNIIGNWEAPSEKYDKAKGIEDISKFTSDIFSFLYGDRDFYTPRIFS